MDADVAAGRGQYLRFALAGESYAFDVLRAREVLSMLRITPLPSSLDFLAGVINLRGSVIPVVDLRKKFGLPPAEEGTEGAIIIVDLVQNGETAVIGALADGVSGVIACDPSALEAPPRFGMQVASALVKAVAKHEGDFVLVLDTDLVFSEAASSAAAAVAAGPAAPPGAGTGA